MKTDTEYPVTIAIQRADGKTENIRIGTAFLEGNEFRLHLDDLKIGQPQRSTTFGPPPPVAPSNFTAAHEPVFPNYGMSKGKPVRGASMRDLEFYAGGCRRTLNDPAKSRWHDKERILLAAIEAEIERQRGCHISDASIPHPTSNFSSPPPMDDVPPPTENFGPPMDDDDDIPF